MNVLFIYPDIQRAHTMQIGLASLSAILKRDGHRTDLFDITFYDYKKECELIVSDLKKKISVFNPDLLAISCRSMEYSFVLKLLASVRDLRIPNILGGPHPTIVPEDVISEGLVNMICIGEGEEALSELLYKMARKWDISGIPNIWTKRDGQISRNEVRPLIQNLDSLPYPDWDIFDDRHFTYSFIDNRKYRRGLFEMSRGCPYSCTYCINSSLQNTYRSKGKYHREKSVERIIEETTYFCNRYNLEMIYFIDESFLVKDIEIIRLFSKMYREKVGLPFLMMTRPENITKEKLLLIKSAGCRLLSIGIESGNEKYRREILNRRMSQEQIVNAFRIAKEVDLTTYSFNMVGLPYENRKMVFDTINLNRRVNPDVIQVTIFYPFPGTKLKDICVKEGFLQHESDGLSGYYEKSILSMPELFKSQIEGLKRTFLFYYKFPKIFYPLIRVLEYNSCFSKIFPRVYNSFEVYRWYTFAIIYRKLIEKFKKVLNKSLSLFAICKK